MKRQKFSIIIIVIISFAFAFSNNCGRTEETPKTEILIAADWGDKEGEFGIYDGDKIPEKYGVVDFIVTEDEIYILDGLNGRIQVFDLKGDFKKVIKYANKWEDFGLAWGFTLYKNNFYMLVGRSPHFYSTGGYKEIHKFSYDGKLISTFGEKYSDLMVKKHLDRMESYYGSIFSHMNRGYLAASANWDILLFNDQGDMKYNVLDIIGEKSCVYSLRDIDDNGNLVIIKFRQDTGDKGYIHTVGRNTIIYNAETKTIKMEVPGRFDHVDNKGNLYFIRTYSPKRNNPDLVTEITKYESRTKTKKIFEVSGDVKVIKNGKGSCAPFRKPVAQRDAFL